jgi:hypothetical protein
MLVLIIRSPCLKALAKVLAAKHLTVMMTARVGGEK